jgi:hypothetical protein
MLRPSRGWPWQAIGKAVSDLTFSKTLERFPITWNHVIGKESLKFKELEHSLLKLSRKVSRAGSRGFWLSRRPCRLFGGVDAAFCLAKPRHGQDSLRVGPLFPAP